MSAPENLGELLDQRKILICCGSGGVGKTTTSASLALHAALVGKKAVVCTIDPARRLANSLGLTEIGNEIVQVDPSRLAELGGKPNGSLHALMLDTKGTFDRLIARYAKTEEARERIFKNRFYRQMSGTVVGSSDYMAMEKLYELHDEGTYDLIVLDTPPTKHALDFLQAPQRMSDAFDRGTLDLFLRPWAEAGKRSLGFLGRALNRLVKKVDQLVGLKFVEDLAEFFRAFDGMYDGFRGRAQKVDALLRDPNTSFLVVASPKPLPLAEASFFCEKLKEFSLPIAGVIVNRVHTSAVGDTTARERLQARLRAEGPRAVIDAAQAGAKGAGEPPELLDPLLRAFVDHELLAAGDQARIGELKQGPAQGLLVTQVPSFPRDVHDVAGLKHIIDHLFPNEAA